MVRLVDTDVARPELTAAIDEALLRSRVEGRCGDTVHLYRRDPPSVSIGYFQSAGEVAYLEACARDGVPVVRRSSGGGAIFTDDRQVVYAVVFAANLTAREGFDLACGALVRVLGRLGVRGAEKSGVNDVLVWGRKVSGSAQVIRKGVHLVHGTMLVDSDLERMFTYLRPLPEKLEAQGIERPRARVTTLKDVLGRAPPLPDVKTAIAEEMAKAIGGPLEPGALSETELEEAGRLVEERFSRDSWNLRR